MAKAIFSAGDRLISILMAVILWLVSSQPGGFDAAFRRPDVLSRRRSALFPTRHGGPAGCALQPSMLFGPPVKATISCGLAK
jgi:hypothetical protein